MDHRFPVLFLLILFCFPITKARAQTAAGVNYTAAKVPAYTLPDPLLLPNGKKITTAVEWVQKQRPYLLQLFRATVYGKMPGKPTDQFFKVRSVDSFALNGKAIRKQVTVFFSRREYASLMHISKIDFLQKPLRCFLFLFYYAIHVKPAPALRIA